MRTLARYRHTALVALAGLVVRATAGTSARPFPDLIPLPADFGPEGIAVGNGSTFYAGSLAAATRGQILVGDLRTGETATLVPADDVPATGMKYDARSSLLFVARAASGMGTVFDAASGDVVASYQFHAAPTFVNDVVITREAAYFTDTQAPFLYRVALGPAGGPRRRLHRSRCLPRSGPTASPPPATASTSSSSPRRNCIGSTLPRTRRSSWISAERHCPTPMDCCSTARRCTSCRIPATGSRSSNCPPVTCPARSCDSLRNPSPRIPTRRCRPPSPSSAMRCTR